MQAGSVETAVPEIEAAFATLYVADSVKFGEHGFTPTRAFRTLREAGPAQLSRLQWLLEHASPAGRVYAATLIHEIDAQAGVQAWQWLATKSGTFDTGGESAAAWAGRELRKLAPPPVELRKKLPPRSGSTHPAVDSDVARRAINEALLARPRVVVVTARDEQHFVRSLFGDRPNVYVCRQTRDGTESGPHFDVYQSIIDPACPFVATFNLAGAAIIHSTELDPELAAYYSKHYAEQSDDAYAARRLLGGLALRQPGMRKEQQNIAKGAGMIIPQRVGALPVVHDVRPTDQSEGVFLKFIVPKGDGHALAAALAQGFNRWQPGTDWDDAASDLTFTGQFDRPKYD